MEYKIVLSESDYLVYQLYKASKSDRIASQRKKSWILSVIGFFALTFLFYQSGNRMLAYYFLGASVLFLIFYPFYSRWRYKRHYQKFIRENYKNRFNEPAIIELTDEYVLTRDKTGESKVNASEIEEINETGSHLFLKLSSGHSFIVPKSKIDKLDLFTAELHKLKAIHRIKYNRELDWRWK